MLSFAQPLFLLALAGLAVPVLIHRISRALPIAWRFPSIARIRKTPLPRQGRRRISDWLLMLLRIALLALLILALAGPSWTPPESSATPSASPRRAALVLFDVSSSMAGWEAVPEGLGIIESLKETPATDWGWIAFSDTVKAERLPPLSGSDPDPLDDIAAWLRKNPPDFLAGNPRPALARAAEILQSVPGSKSLHIISDFQATDWSKGLMEIPRQMDITFHRVGTSRRNRNLALQSVVTVPTSGERLRILGRIMNYGQQALESTVRLELESDILEQKALFEPGTLTTVAFEIPEASRQSRATLSLPAGTDPYDRDNRLSFKAAPPPPLDILAINPGASSMDGDEETFFLSQALDTTSRNEWIRYSVLPVGLDPVNPESLARTAAVFVPASTSGDGVLPWRELHRYVEEGGLLAVTLGEDAVRALRNLRSAGFPTGDYLGLAGRGRGERFFLGPLPLESPLTDVFTGPARRDLYLMGIRQFARLSPPDRARVLLQSESGDPLLITIPVGSGYVVLSLFPWDRRASDFPLRPSFLPIVREIFAMHGSVSESLPGNPSRKSTAPPSESVIDTVETKGLISRLRGGSTVSPPLTASLTPEGRDTNALALAPWLLLLTLFLWVTESFLAGRLIRQSSHPSSRSRE